MEVLVEKVKMQHILLLKQHQEELINFITIEIILVLNLIILLYILRTLGTITEN
jgi:hypothetical protein